MKSLTILGAIGCATTLLIHRFSFWGAVGALYFAGMGLIVVLAFRQSRLQSFRRTEDEKSV